MNFVYYSQVDSRWKNHPYPSQSLPNATIGSGGCGATCAAMVVSMLKQIIKPDAMGDLFLKDGIRVNGGTSNAAFDSYLTNKFGLKASKKWKIAEAKECLEKGGIVVARCISSNGTLFTTGGHFIVLAGFKDNKFEVFDPYLYSNKFNIAGRSGKATVSGTSVFVTFENMKAYGGYNELWCYEPTGINTNIDTSIKPTSQPVASKPDTSKPAVTKTVGQKRVFKGNTTLYSKSNLSGTTYSYLPKTEVTILENISASVDKIKVVKTGRVAYVSTSAYTVSTSQASAAPSYKIMTVTAVSGLRVRKEPNTKSQIVTCYAYKTKVKVYSISNGWAKGEKGYLCATYLK